MNIILKNLIYLQKLFFNLNYKNIKETIELIKNSIFYEEFEILFEEIIHFIILFPKKISIIVQLLQNFLEKIIKINFENIILNFPSKHPSEIICKFLLIKNLIKENIINFNEILNYLIKLINPYQNIKKLLIILIFYNEIINFNQEIFINIK